MRVYYHKIGQNQSQDSLMFDYPEQPDALLAAHSTHDGNYLLIQISQGADSKILLYYADLTKDENKNLDQKLVVKPVVTEWVGSYDYINNIGKEFYFATDYNAPLSKIVKFNIEKPAFENWIDVVPEHKKNVLQSAGTMKNGTVMLVNYLVNAAEKIKIYNFETPAKLVKNVEMPGFGAVPISSGGHKDYEMFFKFQTFTDPGSVYRLDMNTYKVEALRRP